MNKLLTFNKKYPLTKKLFNIAIIITSIILLCSCARQRYINQNEFVKQFNENSQAVKLEEADYYFKDNSFYYFTNINDSRNIMITLKQNEKFDITTAELTVIKEEAELEEGEKDEIFKTALSLISVICNCEEAEALKEAKKEEFNKDCIAFSFYNKEFQLLKSDCFLCANDEIISFSVKIK